MSGDTVEIAYREVRERLSAWGRTLTDEQAATPVPALPGWTVKDTFAHLVGNVADALERNMVAPPDDDQTAAQVAERADRSLADVLDEWERRAAPFDALLHDLGSSAPQAVVLDVWTHEIDMRSALGEPIPSGGAAEEILAGIVRRAVGRSSVAGGLPVLRIVTERDDWIVGEGDPVVTLRITTFDLGRMLLGRRSPAQMAALEWAGADPAGWIRAIPFFGPSEVDVVDSPRA